MLGTPAAARMPASCPAPDGSSTAGTPSSVESRAGRRADGLVHRDGLDAERGLESDRGHEAVEPLAVRRARVDAEGDGGGDDVHAAGLDREPADGRDRVGDRACRVADLEHPLGGTDERVLPVVHRRRARMPRPAGDRELAPRVADDAGHDRERCAEPVQTRALLDMQLDIGGGQRGRADAESGCRRSHAPRPGRRRRRARGAPAARPPRAPPRRPAPRRSGRRRARCRGATPSTPRGPLPGTRPIRLPPSSTSSSRPASTNHAAARSCACCSSGE